MAWTISQTYSQVNDYSAKDALASGQAEKIILGSDIDDELSGIATALNLKLDSGSVSSQAEAEGGTDTESVMTPQGVQYWGDANAGIIGDLRALADPAANTLFGWDDTANAAKSFVNATNGGISISTGTFSVDLNDLVTETSIAAGDFLAMVDITDSGSGKITFANLESTLNHDSLAGYVADEHVAHAGVTITAGAGMTGGGDISATRTLDVVAGSTSASNPIVVNANDIDFDLSSITELTIENMSQSADGVLISDAGTLKVMPYDSAGFKVQTAQTTQTLALTDANTVMEFDGTATVTIPIDATHTWEAGSAAIICTDHATQVVTITAAATVTLNSVNHPGGAAAASDAVRAGGTAVLLYLGGDEWYLSGDIQD